MNKEGDNFKKLLNQYDSGIINREELEETLNSIIDEYMGMGFSNSKDIRGIENDIR